MYLVSDMRTESASVVAGEAASYFRECEDLSVGRCREYGMYGVFRRLAESRRI